MFEREMIESVPQPPRVIMGLYGSCDRFDWEFCDSSLHFSSFAKNEVR